MTGPDIGPHRRQYVIGVRPVTVRDGWVHRSVAPDLWLSHCPELRVAEVAGPDGAWVLVGRAIQTRPDRPDPLDELGAVDVSGVPDRYESWCGRWLLIGHGELHLDASGQLGCHYGACDGEVWASSSPALLAESCGSPPRRRVDLVHDRALSWYVPPRGGREGLHRLLPSQILRLVDGSVRSRRLVPPLSPTDSDDAVGALAGALAEPVRRLAAHGAHVTVAVSAGADSRAVLAAAVSAGVPVEAMTRRASRMTVADRVLPPRLSAAVGVAHRELRPRGEDPARWELARVHTDEQVSHGDALPFLQATRDGLGGVELGGQGFGVGKVLHRDLPDSVEDPDVTAETIADGLGEPIGSPNRDALADWLRWWVDNPTPDLDWRDAFYIEQRMGGWQASKEQLYDLEGHERIAPVNAARSHALLLAAPPEQRRSGEHQLALIRRLDARLAEQPVNPPGRDFGLAARASHVLAVDRFGWRGRLLSRSRRR